MKLDHSFTVPVGVEEAWRVLLDIERIAPCMPGAAVDSIDGDNFTGTVKVKLGPINLTYKGSASFVEKDESAHRAVIDARGKDSRGNGTAAAKITATLKPDGDATTVGVLTELDITGKPAQFGRGVMVDVGNKLLGQFAECLASKLAAGEDTAPEPSAAAPADAAPEPSVAAPAEAAPAPTPSGGRKAGAKKADPAPGSGTAEAPQPGDTGSAAQPGDTGSAAQPGDTGSAAQPGANGRHSVPAPAEPEPIDLLASAGPAVAKRIAPVAGALVLVAIIVAILRRRSRGR